MSGDRDPLMDPPVGGKWGPTSKLDEILDLLDQVQFVHPGSYVEVTIHVPESTYRTVELSDQIRLYSLRIESK